MVLTRWHFDPHNLRIERSTGWALAIAINALLLVLLSLPLRQQTWQGAIDEPAPAVEWITLRPSPPAPPAPPPPSAPQRAQSVLSEVLRSPAPAQEHPVLLAQPPETASAPGEAIVASESRADSAGMIAPETGDAQASIDYDLAPLPPYPRAELLRGAEGTVLLRVEVDANGHVVRVEVERSSGYSRLDRAAQQHVARHWRFRPALRDGLPVAGWVRVPIDFRLDRG